MIYRVSGTKGNTKGFHDSTALSKDPLSKKFLSLKVSCNEYFMENNIFSFFFFVYNVKTTFETFSPAINSSSRYTNYFHWMKLDKHSMTLTSSI